MNTNSTGGNKKERTPIRTGPTHHYNKNSHKDCSQISEQCQCMLHIIQVTKVSPFNNFLSVYYNVAHKHQKPKVQLQELQISTPGRYVIVYNMTNICTIIEGYFSSLSVSLKE